MPSSTISCSPLRSVSSYVPGERSSRRKIPRGSAPASCFPAGPRAVTVQVPAATFAERQGSYTNVEGVVQFLRPPIALKQPLMEGWQVLCELGTALGLPMDYSGIVPIQREMKLQTPDPSPEPTPVLVGPAHP